MPVTQTATTAINEERGTLTVQTSHSDGLQLKTMHEEDGEEKSIIEGYAATTHIDQTNDRFQPEALEQMAEQIRNDANATVDVVFPQLDGMEESQIGNINHNNNPAAEKLIGAGDTRTVPVFKTTYAETRKLADGETGLHIRGEMMPLPDDLEDAVKGQIKEGGLHSFSIEFRPTNVEFNVVDGEPVRDIYGGKAQGNALTGRPMNQEANLTDAELKSMINGDVQVSDRYQDAKTNVKTEDTSMSDNEEEEQVEQQEAEETPEQEEQEVENDSGEEETPEQEDEDTEETVSEADEVKNDVKELKSMFEDIKEENEELREERDELKAKLEDLETVETVKSEISEIKSMIEDSDADLEGERPIVDQDQSREVKTDSNKAQWKNHIDQLGLDEHDLKTEIGNKGMTEAESIADLYGVKTEEVMDYVK